MGGNVRFAHGTRYATDCVAFVVDAIPGGVNHERLRTRLCLCLSSAAERYYLIPTCDDRTLHGRRSRGLVGSPSPVCFWSSNPIKTREVHVSPVLPVPVVGRPRDV